MKKPPSHKKQMVNELKRCIRLSRKTARQINRKLEQLKYWNLAKKAAQEQLVKLCNIK